MSSGVTVGGKFREGSRGTGGSRTAGALRTANHSSGRPSLKPWPGTSVADALLNRHATNMTVFYWVQPAEKMREPGPLWWWDDRSAPRPPCQVIASERRAFDADQGGSSGGGGHAQRADPSFEGPLGV